MSEEERRLSAIMFTDLQGYTAMTQKDERGTMRLLDQYKALTNPVLGKYRGREVKTMGDGSLVEFGSALDATECACEIQKVARQFNQTAQHRLIVRIGIHVGDVIHRGGDVLGDAVNIASRIEPLAAGGGVCISEQVYFQVRNKVSYSMKKVEAGGMKNISYPTGVYRVEMPWERSERETGPLDRRRLAVLPLANISPDPNDEYFADGLTEELITTLSRVKGLEVIARTSVLRYKGGGKQVALIGQELNVGSVLEGSVRKAGNRIRVTAQLVNTSNESHVWAESYDRQLDDIFAVQSDIAGRVADSLRMEFSERGRDVRQPIQNLEAYTLYLKGRFASTKLTKDAQMRAIDFFHRAVTLAPEFAACHAAMAQAWGLLGFFELVPQEEAFAKSKESASKAISLDDGLAEGHVAMGRLLRMGEWKFEEAEEEMKKATELDPNLSTAHVFRAHGLLQLNRKEEAEAEAKRGLELDPFSVTTCQVLGTIYLYTGRYDEAIEYYDRALEIEPKSPFPLGNLGLAYVQKGMLDKGIPMVEEARTLEGANPSNLNDLAYAYGKAGRIEEVRKILQQLLEMREGSRRAAAAIAGVYTTLGDHDKAMEWLEKAYEERTPYLSALNSDFIFDPLRNDPRFAGLTRRIGLP